MKHYKIPPKAPTTTRQEIDTLTRAIGKHIEKDPKKAARIFENWIGKKTIQSPKKKAA